MGVRTLVPLDIERREPLFGNPGMVADYSDELFENDDLAYAWNLLGLAVIDVTDLASKHGTDRYRRELHARRHGVDAIHDLAIHLIGGVDSLEWLADQGELARVLRCDISGRRQPARVVDQRGVSKSAATRLLGHRTVGGMAGVGATFQRRAAASINMARVVAPALRNGAQKARMEVEPPVACS